MLDRGCVRAHHSHVRENERRDSGCVAPCFERELVAQLRADMPSDAGMEQARLRFAALADKNRLKVLHALGLGGELCVCDVAHVLGLTVSTASHHLRKLRDLGILQHRDDGKMTYYSLKDRSIARLVRQELGKAAA